MAAGVHSLARSERCSGEAAARGSGGFKAERAPGAFALVGLRPETYL